MFLEERTNPNCRIWYSAYIVRISITLQSMMLALLTAADDSFVLYDYEFHVFCQAVVGCGYGRPTVSSGVQLLLVIVLQFGFRHLNGSVYVR